MPEKKSALFLDRDGVLNIRKFQGYIQFISEFTFLPQVTQALRLLQPRFDYLFIVTNQQGVAKGLMTREDVEQIHAHMLQRLADHGIHIQAVYVAYDLADAQPNARKPNPTMGHWALRDFPDIDFTDSLMVGDTASDMRFGRALQMKCAWIRSGPPFDEQVSSELYDWQGESLFQLAQESPHILPKI